MAAPPKITTPAQVLKFRFVHEVETGTQASSSMYFVYTGGRPSVSDCNALAADASTAWNSHCAALMSGGGLLLEVVCQDIFDTHGAEGISTTTHAGTRSGSQPTVGTCAVVQYKINEHYRGGKPKGFWPFGVVADSSGASDWTGGFQSTVGSAMAAFAGAISGSSSGTTVVAQHTAVSFYSGKAANTDTSPWAPRNMPAPRGTAVLYTVQSYLLTTKFGSQRRRLT
jgi:hypothetical protein